MTDRQTVCVREREELVKDDSNLFPAKNRVDVGNSQAIFVSFAYNLDFFFSTETKSMPLLIQQLALHNGMQKK